VKIGQYWPIKKRKSPRYVVEINEVGQYLRKNWAIKNEKSEKVRSLLFQKRKSGNIRVKMGQYLQLKVPEKFF
jgi:hypothetical protein